MTTRRFEHNGVAYVIESRIWSLANDGTIVANTVRSAVGNDTLTQWLVAEIPRENRPESLEETQILESLEVRMTGWILGLEPSTRGTRFRDLHPSTRLAVLRNNAELLVPGWSNETDLAGVQVCNCPTHRRERREEADPTTENDGDTCFYCGTRNSAGADSLVRGFSATQFLCGYCRNDYFCFCSGCDMWIDVDRTGYNWDYARCHECRPDREEVINYWNYRPELSFFPIPPDNHHPLYIGMELEVSFENRGLGEDWFRDKLMEYEFLYAKEDSSVRNGFEVVTHPMQPAWAMENFPFQAFQTGIESYGLKLEHPSCGTHIHMNKDAFGPALLWKFLKIHMKLSDFCGLVGGRGTDAEFGTFHNAGRGSQSNFLGVDRQQLLEIAKKKGKFDNPQRYVAVNLRNEYTLELRYMRGGIAPSEIKKNIQWALALYNFADYLNVSDVKEGALDNPGYLLWYITQHQEQYPDLMAWIDKRVPRPMALRERSN